jgi:peptidoglycan/LPS O-acetylase OafA/YrhL
MKDEIFGSILIFLYLKYSHTIKKYQFLILFLTTIYLLYKSPDLSCFFMGFCIAKINKTYSHFEKNIDFVILPIFACIILIFTFCFIEWDWINAVLSACLVLLISYSFVLRKFFQSKFSLFLGEISFTMYLLQIIVICSATSYIYLKLLELNINSSLRSDINLISSILICISLAFILNFIDKSGLKLGKLIIKK